jgi:NAD(P)-dependent dehydrogenase (short-subunit alcohol dehydrogenase family)
MKSVVITGSSTGIGRACVLMLDRNGFRVFAGVRKEADGDALRSTASESLTPVHIDVTDAV